MVELRRMARHYAESNPYEVVRIREPKGKGNRWRYRITLDSTDPMLAMALGDFVHNLRTALDHVVVACAPPRDRKAVSFPVAYENVWVKDPRGHYVHPDTERRDEYGRIARILPFGAFAVIEGAQPYRSDRAAYQIIGIVSRLENTDKHRKLIAVGTGVEDGIIRFRYRDAVLMEERFFGQKFLKHDTEIFSIGAPRPGYIDESELEMEVSGTASIHIQVTGIDGGKDLFTLPLRGFLVRALSDTRHLLKRLEDFVVRA